jgi:D-alanyl-D-alanine carboxypeptidase
MSDPTRRWTPLEQIEYAIAEVLGVHPPGEAVHYSNTGFVILAIVIERITGTGLASAFRELLRLDDLRLDSVHLESLEPTPASAGPRVRQYMGSLDVSDVDPSIDLFGGGGIVSNVRDLVGFWRELFSGRVFDSPATLERMTVTRRRSDAPGDAGLGIFRELQGGHEFWYHTGFWGSAVRHEAASGLTLAYAINQVWSPATTQAVSRLEDELMRSFDMRESSH